MVRKRRDYPDDDGRTVADMSGLEGPNLFRVRRPEGRPRRDLQAPPEPEEKKPDPMGDGLDKEDRRLYIFASLKAALLIALAFIVGLGLLVALLLLLWKR